MAFTECGKFSAFIFFVRYIDIVRHQFVIGLIIFWYKQDLHRTCDCFARHNGIHWMREISVPSYFDLWHRVACWQKTQVDHPGRCVAATVTTLPVSSRKDVIRMSMVGTKRSALPLTRLVRKPFNTAGAQASSDRTTHTYDVCACDPCGKQHFREIPHVGNNICEKCPGRIL